MVGEEETEKEEGVVVVLEDEDNHKSVDNVCVCLCSGLRLWDGTVKHAIPIARAPPDDIPSIPWGSWYYLLLTPGGACKGGVSYESVYLGSGTPWQLR